MAGADIPPPGVRENGRVEIRDHVSRLRWRLSILVVLPVIAGALAFGALVGTPDQRVASTVLTVPSSVIGGTTAGSVAQYVANFEQAIVSDPVIERITSTFGVEGAEVRDGLQTTQLGSSNLIRVSYQGSDDVVRIADMATKLAFETVAQIQLPFGESPDVLEERVRVATSDLRTTEKRLEAFLLENNLVLPREQYLMVASEVASLEQEIVQARSAGVSTATLEEALRDRRQELDRLGSLLPTYERLQAAVDRAAEDLDAAEDEMRLVEDQSAHLGPQMTVITTQVVPRVRTIGKGVGIAAAAGFIVALALMFLFPSKRAFPSGMERSEFGFPVRT